MYTQCMHCVLKVTGRISLAARGQKVEVEYVQTFIAVFKDTV